MKELLNNLHSQYQELEKKLASDGSLNDQEAYQKAAKEYSDLTPIMRKYELFKEKDKQLEEVNELLAGKLEDAEMASMYEEEKKSLVTAIALLTEELEAMVLEQEDPNKDRNAIVEIRAGTGGEEAALFAGDLYRMYQRFSMKMGYQVEPLSLSETGLKGIKEVIFTISGTNCYSKFQFESGTHRVQRVPETESSGRIHTSAVTVAVLPEAEEVEVQIDPNELKVDVYRSSGPGGQSVNTTDSAVRITHIPTGLVVTCQDEKSQHKNKAKALRVLRARLFEIMQAEQNSERADTRKQQVGSGDRSERIRTYNFPEKRVTDHRINVTLYNLDQFLEGEIDEIILELEKSEREAKLKKLTEDHSA